MTDKERDDMLSYIAAEVSILDEESISKKGVYVFTIFNSLILVFQLILWLI